MARRSAKGGFDWVLSQLAVDGGLEQAKQVVVLGDGAPWIWNLAAEHFPGAVQSVDLSHAQDHVWDVAHAVFGPGTAAGTAWATHACSLLEQGHGEALISAISALPPIPAEPGQARRIPDRAVDYCTTNAARMRYPVFRAHGMHIGSGEASAACKTIVSTRAKRSGMRSCLCVPPFSMVPTIRSGSKNMLPACLQPIHTPWCMGAVDCNLDGT